MGPNIHGVLTSENLQLTLLSNIHEQLMDYISLKIGLDAVAIIIDMHPLTKLVQKVANVFIHFCYNCLTLHIRRALSLSSIPHSTRIGQSGCIVMDSSGKSNTGHSEHCNHQPMRSHSALELNIQTTATVDKLSLAAGFIVYISALGKYYTIPQGM